MTRFFRHMLPLLAATASMALIAEVFHALGFSDTTCAAVGFICLVVSWALFAALVEEWWPANGPVTSWLALADDLADDDELQEAVDEMRRTPLDPARLAEPKLTGRGADR